MKNQSKIGNRKSKIAIVGAGPAGSSLAIRFAKQNFKVTLVEREKFPRHKLCGEFISPECLEHFQDLEVLDEMMVRGGDRISQTVFYAENGKSVSIKSEWFNGNPKGALGLSRAEMDFRLMEKAKELGVEVLEESQVVDLLFEDEKVCGVRTRNSAGLVEELYSDLTIDATGRARVLSKIANKKIIDRANNSKQRTKQRTKPKTKLVGFKSHFKNVYLPKGFCEIYFFRGGYGGLNYVEDGIANHCFLIRADVVKEFKGDVEKILNEVIFKNTRAKETLKDAESLFDWLAVSVDEFGIKDINPINGLISVGDSAAFIDPFTGSGMLMAFESAKILANVVAKNYSSFADIAEEYEVLHHAKFKNRLRICSFMRRLSLAPNFAKTAITVLSWSEKASEILARSTRQTKSKKTSKA